MYGNLTGLVWEFMAAHPLHATSSLAAPTDAPERKAGECSSVKTISCGHLSTKEGIDVTVVVNSFVRCAEVSPVEQGPCVIRAQYSAITIAIYMISRYPSTAMHVHPKQVSPVHAHAHASFVFIDLNLRW